MSCTGSIEPWREERGEGGLPEYPVASTEIPVEDFCSDRTIQPDTLVFVTRDSSIVGASPTK